MGSYVGYMEIKARPPRAKKRISRMVGNIIPINADTTPCAPPIIAATIRKMLSECGGFLPYHFRKKGVPP